MTNEMTFLFNVNSVLSFNSIWRFMWWGKRYKLSRGSKQQCMEVYGEWRKSPRILTDTLDAGL